MSTTGSDGPRGLIRQGDVLLVPVDSIPEGATPRQSSVRHVLAEGEATGHAHVIRDRRARLATERIHRRWAAPRETTYLVVNGPGPVALTHEEHDTLVIPPGVYEVRRQREYRAGRATWVRD
jgi:hypothetical protein